MADIAEIKRFLTPDGSGYGYDSVSGDCYGSGDGCGSGYGSGYDSGSGDGSGDGYGYGYSSGIKSFKNEPVFQVDGINTIIKRVKGNIAKDFYLWHNKLTGSCEMGRQAFVNDHGFDIETDMFTVEEFIELTKNSFGGSVIRQLAEELKKGRKNHE